MWGDESSLRTFIRPVTICDYDFGGNTSQDTMRNTSCEYNSNFLLLSPTQQPTKLYRQDL